jgi:uncharacterized OsmC-like protein
VGDIRTAIDGAMAYLTEHPDEARYTDSVAVAHIEHGLRVRVEGTNAESVTTDMPPSVGGDGSAPSAGWLLRAAVAACTLTLIAIRAAHQGVELGDLEIVVDSESDDRGILGLDAAIPAGPLSMRIAVSADGQIPPELRDIVDWAVEHCPVSDAVKRAVPVTVEA